MSDEDDKKTQETSVDINPESTEEDIDKKVLEARLARAKSMERLYGLELEDIDFISDSKQALLITTPKAANIFLYCIILLLIVAIIWAAFSKIDETTIGQGKVIPTSKVKVIQNLEGGIVEELYVSDGQMVKKGQPLLKLDDTRFSAKYNEEYAKYITLLATIARYQAEINEQKTIDFPDIVKKEAPELAKSETDIFNSRMKDLSTSLNTLKKSYALAEKELKILKPLAEEKIMSDLELIRLQRQVNEIQGKIVEEREKFKADAYKNFKNLQSELAILKKGIEASRDRANRTLMVSPVDGIVKDIDVTTVGEVVPPGQNIMEIVPMDDKLSVEVHVSPKDIAFVRPGDKAYVKLTAYDYAIFGGLEGKVDKISADTIEDDKGNNYYKVVVSTETNHLKDKKGNELPIIPGMMASVNIITGEKSILAYILNPFYKASERAFREP